MCWPAAAPKAAPNCRHKRLTFVSLKKRSDFLRIQKDGTKWVSPSLIVQAAPSPVPGVRVGITITKKTCPLSTDRNRIRRRLREAARAHWAGQVQDGHDIVLIGRADTRTVPFDKLIKDGTWCLKRLGLLKP